MPVVPAVPAQVTVAAPENATAGNERGSGTRPRVPGHPYRWFTLALGILLGGYLFFNKAFAYLHVPGTPLFIGELVLVVGVAESLHLRVRWRQLVASSPILKALLAYMALCAVRLAVDLPTYGIDALRDAAIWYYGLYAFLVAAAVVHDTAFLPTLLRWYRRVLPAFLVWAPVAIVAGQMELLSHITVPDSTLAITAYKPGDYAVHLMMALGYLWLHVDRIRGVKTEDRPELLMSVMGVAALLVAATQSRGGFTSAVLGLLIVAMFLSTARRRMVMIPVAATLSLLMLLIVLADLRLPGDRRDVSLQQLALNMATTLGGGRQGELTDTVDWRQQLWEQVVDDLHSSDAWLIGLGYGSILPERYDIPLDPWNDQPLRNVHNSHLTIMARSGYPGGILWLLLWAVWTWHLLRRIRWLRGPADPEAALHAWLLATTVAFHVNAFFDPALEGPQSGIWLFTIVGVAAALSRYRAPRRRRGPADVLEVTPAAER